MIPPVVAETTDSSAERKIFPMLERTQLDAHAAALHSIDLPRHEYKRMGEIDFIVLSRAGLLVCEVKGGRVSRSANGLWHFTNRYDEVTTKPEGPFKQGLSAMWSLHRDLKERLEPELFKEISFGHCVMLPDCEYDQDCVDAPRELVIDGRELGGARELSRPLQRLLARWQDRNKTGDMSAAALHAARNAIRRSLDLVPSLGVRARGIGASLESLTEQQYVALDWVEQNDRLLISGGAGTGKTMIALEIARREALKGDSVLLTCQSPVLASYLAGRAPATVRVAPVADTAGIVSERGRRFKVVVVDEAQDVFSLEGVTMLDDVLEGGIEAGRWRCLYDLNNQAGLFGDIDTDAFELLRATGAQIVPLRRNCRNTKPVVLQTQTVTAADLGIPMAGDGPPVVFAKPTDSADEAAQLAVELRRLGEAGVSPGQITVLTGGAEPSSLERFERQAGLRLKRLDTSNAPAWPLDHTSVCTIDDFKGFENDFILVCDLVGLDGTQRDRASVYVAMSRARTGLWVSIPATLADHFEELRRENVERILAGQKA